MSIGNPVMDEVIKEVNKFLCILFLKGQGVLVFWLILVIGLKDKCI